MQLDEWHMFQITPFNREIQNIKLSPPLISQPTADSFPPWEAKGGSGKLSPFTGRLSSVRGRADSIRPYRAYTLIWVLAKNRGCGRILAALTGRIRSSGCLRKSGVTGGFYPPLQRGCFLFYFMF